MKKLAVVGVVLGLLGLATTFVLWALPSEEFIFAPGSAKPLAGKVEVAKARPEGDNSVYYVDVYVRRTSLLEELFPFTRPEGSTVVPEHALLPPGTSEAERDRQTAEEMQRSEQIASVVALRQLGYDPEVNPRGALVTGTFVDTPAIGKLELGDVIVAVDGRPVRTPEQLRAAIATRDPGDSVTLTVRRGGKTIDVTLTTIASPTDPERPIVGIQVDQEADVELPFEVDIDLGSVGGGVRLFFSESLSGVINWSLAAPLFSINLVALTALVQRSPAPLKGLLTKDGVVGVVEQAFRVQRWGLWMAPVIYSFLRMAPDPTWYNQDGAIRTAAAIAQSLTLDAPEFRAWSLEVFLGLLAYDWLRILIWFDHMGLRVATLVNLSFVGGDLADERAARWIGHSGRARCIPDGLRRFATWAPVPRLPE